MLYFVVFITYLANSVFGHHIPEHYGTAQDFVRISNQLKTAQYMRFNLYI